MAKLSVRITDILSIENKKCILVDDIDNHKLRMFQLSLLWRASISSKKMFSQIFIGNHEEVIRKLLVNDDPGNYQKYSCVMSFSNKNKLFYRTVQSPVKLNPFESNDRYRFIAGHFGWDFFISDNLIPEVFEETVLSENSKLFLFINPPINLFDVVK